MLISYRILIKNRLGISSQTKIAEMHETSIYFIKMIVTVNVNIFNITLDIPKYTCKNQ